MSRQGILNKRQARTDNAIETFENNHTRSTLIAKMEKDEAQLELLVKSKLCKMTYQSNLNGGVKINSATEKLTSCTLAAQEAYKSTIDIILAYHEGDHKLLAGELDNTLNHALYSQDFEPYWRT